jgi:hypothetical protein
MVGTPRCGVRRGDIENKRLDTKRSAGRSAASLPSAQPRNFTPEKISVLHVFDRVAKRARAAIPRNEFESARAFRNSRFANENKQAPQFYLT